MEFKVTITEELCPVVLSGLHLLRQHPHSDFKTVNLASKLGLDIEEARDKCQPKEGKSTK